MVKICDALKACVEILDGSVEDARFEAEVLAQSVFGMDKLMLRIHLRDEVDEGLCERLLEYAKRRSLGEPTAYITGLREFMSIDFKVNQNVLIPRPDTEILVEAVIDKYKNEKINILDICTGSGAIACSLARYIEKAEVLGVDISEEALEVAEENAEFTSTGGRVKFKKADALNLPIELGEFDVVVSNPPYIEKATIKTLEKTVKDFEPLIALDGGEDGLEFYREIVAKIERCLKPGGELYFEIGFNQGKAVAGIMSKKFGKINILKDLSGNDRVVFGQLV